MDATECLGLPYPECNPPLTKDASDIEQVRDLAEAVDAAVQALDDQITETLTSPDAVRMAGSTTAAGLDIVHPLNDVFVQIDTAGMADTVAEVIRVVSGGWYMIGGFVRVTGGGIAGLGSIGLRIEPLVNGDTISSRQGPGYVTNVGEEVTWTDMALLREGDTLTVMTHHAGNPATSFLYNVEVWALQVLPNV